MQSGAGGKLIETAQCATPSGTFRLNKNTLAARVPLYSATLRTWSSLQPGFVAVGTLLELQTQVVEVFHKQLKLLGLLNFTHAELNEQQRIHGAEGFLYPANFRIH